MKNYINEKLGNEKIIIRFITLYIISLILFLISWTISYLILPEGIIRGIGILPGMAGEAAAETLIKEFLTIFGLNSVGWIIILIGNYILKVKNFSFGYLIPLAWMIMYGIVLGTNSFSISIGEKMAPNLSVLGRSGIYEIMAGCLFAVSTDFITTNYSKNLKTSSIPIPENKKEKIKKENVVGIIISFIILSVAALREAYMIIKL
ncbi:MAG: hypothetical protein R6U59_07735 [Eubacteriales bacterium]